jgi:SAM-dependent methyltransferase
LLARAGLTVPAWRAWERLLARRGRGADPQVGGDGLPLPPPALRVRVVAEADPQVFLESGRAEAAQLSAAVASSGTPIEESGRLLDFGCGCGRVIRHLNGLPSMEVHGTDHDAELIEWVAAHLPFVHANRNGIAPPLPYPDAHFGLVYAISVFTHMTDELSRDWMAEMRRVLRPGGLLLFTVMAGNREALLKSEREAFNRGELVVQFEEGLGTNLCVSYHPQAYIDRLTRDFDRIDSRPLGAQQLWVLQSPG